MAIDLSQFHQVFYEESFENVDIMESSLMDLDPEDVDSEDINTIFRAAHSIKGGAATFGFVKITEFTHVLETLLDQFRAGDRVLRTSDINMFLQSVDCMREMLGSLQEGNDSDTENSQAVLAQFNLILEGGEATAVDVAGAEPEGAGTQAAAKAEDGDVEIRDAADAQDKVDIAQESETPEVIFDPKIWQIEFKPNKDILASGNDPLRIINELATLGEMECETIRKRFPKLKKLNPEKIYLSWKIRLKSEVHQNEIEEIFEWVIDDADIKISLVGGTDIEETETAPNLHPTEVVVDADECALWSIYFEPKLEVLRTGNDPYKLFVALEQFGKIHSIEAQIDLPDFSSMDPELCYMSWALLFDAKAGDEGKINDVFEWVIDEAKIEIKSVGGLFSDDSADDQVSAETSVDVVEPTVTSNVVSISGAAETQTPPAEAVVTASENKEEASVDATPAAEAEASQEKAPEAEAAAAAPKRSKAPKSKSGTAESSSIRVGIDKVDNLINMVGELVITQSMLGQLGTDFDMDRVPKLIEGLVQLEQNTRELQESVMRIRMLPISFVFSRFPRMVRDLSQALSKEIDLQILGDQTELDKTVLEKIGDPLVHLVRNAVDHGIETIADRMAMGKPAHGIVRLNAFHQGGNVVIEVSDDGKGLDAEMLKQKAVEKGVITEEAAAMLSQDQAYDLIFAPGFSTAQVVSDVSGRGVGMDVVKRNIQALNGVIEIKSEVGRGSTITIRLPLTLAILDGQLVRVADHTYIFPIVSIVESLQCKAELINSIAGGCNLFRLREEYVPIIRLAQAFDIPFEDKDLDGSLMVVVESEGEKVGIVVDELLAQQQVVIKSLEHNYRRVKGVSGATILGDGTVALIVDIPGIVRLAGDNYARMQNAAQGLMAQPQNHTQH